LQMVASLLRMELRRADSPGARIALEESIARIISIAAVHDSLSQEGTEMVDLRELVKRLLFAVASAAAPLDLTTEVVGSVISLPAEQATPLALLVNELATNAVKHAFPDRSRGRIEVRLSEEPDTFLIEVRDDGVGLPEGFTLVDSAHLGLQIAQNLVRRDLGGSLELISEGGTKAVIHFLRSALEQGHG